MLPCSSSWSPELREPVLLALGLRGGGEGARLEEGVAAAEAELLESLAKVDGKRAAAEAEAEAEAEVTTIAAAASRWCCCWLERPECQSVVDAWGRAVENRSEGVRVAETAGFDLRGGGGGGGGGRVGETSAAASAGAVAVAAGPVVAEEAGLR
mmetsp:Transcript_48171/g.103793  ORF Transcript_48171/g.103793 Transcript_48171/m.103793 type:complete len:154 (-) Transcript_48171:79-540(-)